MAGDFGFRGFKETERGRLILEIVELHAMEIEILAKHGVAPVKAVDEALAEFEKTHGPLSNSEKQHVGRAIYERLGLDDWEVTGKQEFEGKVFVSGATFARRKTKPIIIYRKYPRPGGDEHPIRSRSGYQLVRPGLPPEARTLAANAVSVRRLEEAIPLLDLGYHIRMGRKGIRPSLIGKDSLVIE